MQPQPFRTEIKPQLVWESKSTKLKLSYDKNIGQIVFEGDGDFVDLVEV